MSDYKKIKTEYAKKTKNRKKKTNNILIGGIFLLCMSLLLFIMAFVAIYDYNDEITYKETERKSYTFVDVEFIPGGRRRISEYWLYVEEEDKPLLITKFTMDTDLLEKLEKLSKGTEISCRVIDIKEFLFPSKCSYEIVEMKTEKELLTLEEYNERTKGNAIIGIIVCPIVGAIFLFLSFFCFKYR